MNTQALLTDLYALVEQPDIEAATDLLFDSIDRLLSAGEFLAVDGFLREVDVNRLPTTLLRSILTITYAGKTHLPYRPVIYGKVYRRMIELRGLERAER